MFRLLRIFFHWILAAVFAGSMLAVPALTTAGAADTGPGEDHLIVSRLPNAGNAQPVTLMRFSGSGVSDGANWALPTADSGSNHRFTLEGNSNAVGALALSADGRYVTLAGYTQPVGATVGNSSDTAPRVVARVDGGGNIDTSTTLGTTFTKVKIRGAVTKDGSAFWVTGHGNETSPKGGMVYAPLGSSTPTVLFSKELLGSSNSAFNNTRSVQLAGGSLYFGSEKGTAGIYKLNGLPTTPPQTPVNLVAYSGEVDPLSELPLEHEAGSGTVDTMYVSQEGLGIVKYSLSGSTWVNRGTVLTGEFAGLTGKVDPEGHFRIYAIQGFGSQNSIVTFTDSAAWNAAPSPSALTTVSTAASGTAYRGVSFAPQSEAAQLPGAPTGVSATAGDSKALLSWTGPSETGSSPISEYRVTPYIGGVPQASKTTGSSATGYTFEGLANGTAYTFSVAAINASGAGPESSQSAPVTPQAPGAPNPTISLSDESLEGTNGDPTNPTVDVTVAQAGTEASALSVAATASSNPSVATSVGVGVAGSGSTRTVSVTPAGGVGYADITLKVTGAEGKSATATLHYAASAASSTPATSRYHTGAADGSTAIDAGGGYMILGDDENNTLRLYRRDASGAPVKTWNFNAQMGNPEEIDIEASAQVGNTIYWTGSMGNSKKGNLKPDRSILFTTHISGSGAATELSFGGYYRGLRADLIGWDEAHGNRFGFAAGAAAGKIPKLINGFNVEGLEFAPGSSSTAYIGFRAPLSPASAGGKAIVVPVTNIDQLAPSGQNTTTHAVFGEPVLMDLGGLSVREIRKNAADEYLILAGSWAAGGEYALYTWDGVPADAPVRTLTSLPATDTGGEDPGAWESIVDVPEPLASGEDLQLVMDNGSTDLYGDGQEAKELTPEFEKSRSDHFTLQLVTPPANETPPSASGATVPGSELTCAPGDWAGDPAPTFTYQWQRDGAPIAGAEFGTYSTTVADGGHEVSCAVTATNTFGSEAATSNAIAIESASPGCLGVSIAGAGSSAQGSAQALWAPAFVAGCPGGPDVSYDASGSGAALGAWNFDGKAGALDTDLALIGADAAPTSAQIANIESGAGGAHVLVVPVAQAAIAVAVHPPAECQIGRITNKQLESVFRGNVLRWGQLDSAVGPGCPGKPITRVVEAGSAGLTAQLEAYFGQVNPASLPCTEGSKTWAQLAAAGGAWPRAGLGGCTPSNTNALAVPAQEGGEAAIEAVNATQGSIGFASLSELEAVGGLGTTALHLQNNGIVKLANATFAEPQLDEAANCDSARYRVPVGQDWSAVSGANMKIGGDAYPLCSLTYDLVLQGYDKAGFESGTATTVRGYLDEVVLASPGQTALGAAHYSPLPSDGDPHYDVLGAAQAAASGVGD